MQDTASDPNSKSVSSARAGVRRRFRCEGCNAFLEESEVEPYGNSKCHVVPAGDPHGDYWPEPCGPVIEISDA